MAVFDKRFSHSHFGFNHEQGAAKDIPEVTTRQINVCSNTTTRGVGGLKGPATEIMKITGLTGKITSCGINTSFTVIHRYIFESRITTANEY